MKRISFIILFLVSLLQIAASQQNNHPTLWKIYISTGYADATSTDVSYFYNSIVDSYRAGGVPIPTQTPFGRTALINTGLFFTRLESVWFGICFGYSYSPSYSNYKDYAGTLKINGAINSYELSLKVKITLTQIGNFPITVSAQPGIAYVNSSIIQELRFLEYPEQNYDGNWSAFAWGPFFQCTLGTSIPVGNFILSLEGGYKFSWNKIYEFDFESSAGNQKMYGPWNIGPSGVLFLLSLEKQL